MADSPVLQAQLANAEPKMRRIIDVIWDELRGHPGDEGLRILGKLLDIINEDGSDG